MEENFDQNKEHESRVEIVGTKHEKKDSECWIKYLVISLATFFGAFLAVYFVLDNMMDRYVPRMYPPPGIMNDKDMERFIKQQDELMKDMEKLPPIVAPLFNNPVKIQTFQEDDDYKIIIDLKPFNGDEKAITFNATANSIKISGKSDKKMKNGEKDISFMQSFSLPQKIDVNDIKTEKRGNNYIITLPIED